MEKTLILFAHPALEKSKVNLAIKRAIESLDSVTFHDLYEEYPNFLIDVGREQSLLSEHTKIIWQHPLYWFSVPALLKQWFDMVLQHGWAYGSEGTALAGKSVRSVVTTGGSAEAYSASGHNAYSVHEFLRPLERTAVLCRMEYLEPFIIHSAFELNGQPLEQAINHYVEILEGD